MRVLLRILKVGAVFVVGGVILLYGGFFIYAYSNTDTKYAESYDERDFDNVTIGMSSSEVLQLLGEPLEKSKVEKDGVEYWIYAKQGVDKTANYFVRTVKIDANNIVISKLERLYID